MRDLMFIVAMFFALVSICAGVTVLLVDLDRQDCTARWGGTATVEYSAIGGCRVLIDGKMVPSRNVVIYKVQGN